MSIKIRSEKPDDEEASALEADQGQYLGIVQIIARRNKLKRVGKEGQA